MSALADLLLLVKRSRSVWTWVLLTLAATSLADWLWNIGPPFPDRWMVVLSTVAVEAVVFIVSCNSYRYDGDAHLRSCSIRACVLLVIVAACYFAMTTLLVMHLNDVWNTDARGLLYTAHARQLKATHQELADWEMVFQSAGDMKAIYRPWTVDLMRTVLFGLWQGMYTAIAFALALQTVSEARRKSVMPL